MLNAVQLRSWDTYRLYYGLEKEMYQLLPTNQIVLQLLLCLNSA